MPPAEDAELLLHATAVAIGGRGVLLTGPPGAGKSDLALRMIDGGAILVADDQTVVRRRDHLLIASAPATIAGRIEVRGLGIVRLPHLADAPVVLLVDLVEASAVERMPAGEWRAILGVPVPILRLAPFEASAPAKLRLAAAGPGRQ
ncbi:MAG: HPr kinase/phosphorylase [Alphaproteobacteria bacterium]